MSEPNHSLLMAMLTAGLFGAGTGTVFANQHQDASASAGTKITNVQTANNFAL